MSIQNKIAEEFTKNAIPAKSRNLNSRAGTELINSFEMTITSVFT